MNDITRETPLFYMTAGQLVDLIQEQTSRAAGQSPEGSSSPGPRYVYGLRGIQRLFNCSNVTAQRYKAGIIKDAVSQHGRKIVVDADKALELFNASREE